MTILLASVTIRAHDHPDHADGVRWQDGHCVPAGVAEASATWVLDYDVTAIGIVLTLDVPLVALRVVTGHDSPCLP
ncbi:MULTISPECIES: hypothetical protein [Frankia]|uniref:hypothetical protein n=1 Tax=Frankia TaxID=1854 RepID=UPI000A3EACDA|nr:MULTISPECIES: hypothetical protein [Frankia]